MKKIEFKNLPDKTTPINSINLNQLQDNVKDVFEGNEAMGSIVVEDITCKNMLDFDSITKYNRDLSSSPTVGSALSFYTETKALQFYIPATNLRGKTLTYSNSSKYSNYIRIFELDSDYKYIKAVSRVGFTVGNTTSYLCVILKEATAISLTADIKPQLEKGSTATEYTPFKKFGYNAQESMGNIVVDGIVCKNIYDSYSYPLMVNNAINGDTGDIYSSTTNWYATKEYIPVNKYVGKNIISSSDSTTICFYDSSKAFISKISKQGIIPTNAYYMRFDTHKDYVNELYIELGTTLTDYTSHKKFGYNSTDSMGEIVVDDISCKNLFDKNDAITGYRLGSDGALFADSNYFCSGFITVKPNIQYTANWAMETRECVCYYDESYNFIERNGSIKTFTTPSNCHHVRMTGLTSDINNRQLEKGSVSTDYVEHKEFGKESVTNWTILNNGYGLRYRKVGNDVELSLIKSDTAVTITKNGTLIELGTLPVECRPSTNIFIPVTNGGNLYGSLRLLIYSSGVISLQNLATSDVTFTYANAFTRYSALASAIA